MLSGVDAELYAKGKFLNDNFEKIESFGKAGLAPPMAFPEGFQEPGLIDPATKRLMQDTTVLNRPRIFRLDKTPLLVQFDEPFDTVGLENGLKGTKSMSTVEISGRRIRVLSVPLNVNRKLALVGQVTSDLSQTEAALQTLRNTMLWFTPLVVLASLAGGLTLTSIALRPVKIIADAAERIEATSLDRRLPVESNDEFGKLSKTFNSLLERLQLAFDRQSKSLELQQRFTADASHELKTPLTALKTRIGLARHLDDIDQVQTQLGIMDDIADRMKGLILGLLTLARAEEGKLKLELEQKRARALIDSAIKIGVPSGATLPVVKLAEDPVLLLDAGLIAQALANVIQNGVRYSKPGEPIVIKGQRLGESFVFEIRDSGAGIAAADQPHIFDRFYRSDLHRSREAGGTGLGLAIVKAIIDAHHGDIRVDSTLGVGTTFLITIPLDVSLSSEK
jgi:signal transduction histidine kinase